MKIREPEREPRLVPGKAFFTEQELAERLGVSRKWLQKTRYKGVGGVPHRKIGSRVRYYVSDILEFEANALRASTSDPGFSAKKPGTLKTRHFCFPMGKEAALSALRFFPATAATSLSRGFLRKFRLKWLSLEKFKPEIN